MSLIPTILIRPSHTGAVMGLVATISTPIERLIHTLPLYQVVLLGFVAFLGLAVALNVARQLFFHDKSAPPEVFSWFPIIGNT